jgi:hypothetical protein
MIPITVSVVYRALDQYTIRRLRRWLCHKHKVRNSGHTRFPDRYFYTPLGLVRLRLLTQTRPGRPHEVLSESRMREIRTSGSTSGTGNGGPSRTYRASPRLYIGVPKGIRTPVTAVKGRCPRPLDDGDWHAAASRCTAVPMAMRSSGGRRLHGIGLTDNANARAVRRDGCCRERRAPRFRGIARHRRRIRPARDTSTPRFNRLRVRAVRHFPPQGRGRLSPTCDVLLPAKQTIIHTRGWSIFRCVA